MEQKKMSFFERLTGSVRMEDPEGSGKNGLGKDNKQGLSNWIEEESHEAELAVDVYQTPANILIETMV